MKKILLALLIGAVAQTNCLAQWENLFNCSYSYSTGDLQNDRTPIKGILSDMDNDGDSDIVFSKNISSSGFGIIFNDGAGHFSPVVNYYATSESFDLAVADLNGDTLKDVVVSNTGPFFTGNSVSVFMQLANHTFASPVNYQTGNGPLGVACGDFNHDGFIDIAAANNDYATGTTVSVLLNTGSGTFAAQNLYSCAVAPYRLESADLNHDGFDDLIVGNDLERVTILLNNAGTTFDSASYSTGFFPSSSDYFPNITLYDIDNDNDVDVFYTTNNIANVVLFINTNGVLSAPQNLVFGASPSFAISDLNNDSIADIVTATGNGSSSDGFNVYTGNGTGYSLSSSYGAGQYTSCVLAGNINGDSLIDIATVDNWSMNITIHPNIGNGNFAMPVEFKQNYPDIATKAELGDLNNDGFLDLVTSADGRTAINVKVAYALNDGHGNFLPPQDITTTIGGVGAKIRDLNNDGYNDIIFASGINTAPYDFFTVMNNGNGTFGSVQRWSVNSCGWNDLESADVDGDGDFDAIMSEWLGCPTDPNSAKRIYICMNDGLGNFSSPQILLSNPSPAPLAFCDFDEDGDLDITAGHSTSVDVYSNDGSGNFTFQNSHSMAQSPYDIIAVDLNNDGHADLASCNYGSNPGDYSVSIRLGNGNGSFQAINTIMATYSPSVANVSGLTAGDIDNDGDVDLLLGQNASNNILLLLNDGLGNFSKAGAYMMDHSARSPKIADLDNDGKNDLFCMIALPLSGISSGAAILKGLNTGIINEIQSWSLKCSVSEFTSVAKINAGNGITIYPNPSSGEFRIVSNGDHKINAIEIFDALGRKIFSSDVKDFSPEISVNLNQNEYKAGIYNVRLSGDANVSSARIILE